jgi:acetylornithine deacetylase/succinyl-diaminopimelate desuccinylase-like protein
VAAGAGHGYDESVELGEVEPAAAFCAHLIIDWTSVE